MANDQSILVYFFDAGIVVKTVMLLLLTASLVSWTLIFERGLFLKRTRLAVEEFENLFWSGVDLSKLYSDIHNRGKDIAGLGSIFLSGFKEFVRLTKQVSSQPATIMEGVQRAMRIANSREKDKLDQHLAVLATIGSTSPYVGLFGTVWGIMSSFHALGNVQQATIALVAPGISEALVATAMGLFAAIPAVIAYNRFANDTERLLNHYDTFQEEFSSILYRQTHTGNKA